MKKLRGIRLPDATTKWQAGERGEVVLLASGDVAKTFVRRCNHLHISRKRQQPGFSLSIRGAANC